MNAANRAGHVYFEKQVREALGRIQMKRAHGLKSPRGGLDFEDAAVEFIGAATRRAPCLLEVSWNPSAMVVRCKKSDAVLRSTSESAFGGAGIVFEEKRDSACAPRKSRDAKPRPSSRIECFLAREKRNP